MSDWFYFRVSISIREFSTGFVCIWFSLIWWHPGHDSPSTIPPEKSIPPTLHIPYIFLPTFYFLYWGLRGSRLRELEIRSNCSFFLATVTSSLSNRYVSRIIQYDSRLCVARIFCQYTCFNRWFPIPPFWSLRCLQKFGNATPLSLILAQPSRLGRRSVQISKLNYAKKSLVGLFRWKKFSTSFIGVNEVVCSWPIPLGSFIFFVVYLTVYLRKMDKNVRNVLNRSILQFQVPLTSKRPIGRSEVNGTWGQALGQLELRKLFLESTKNLDIFCQL